MHLPDDRPFIVGVTGGIGSGKSTVTDFFATQGVSIFDADIAARAVVKPGQIALKDITQRYGSKILLNNGSLDRKQLRSIIFKNTAERTWLEKLLHPKIRTLLQQQLLTASSPYAILSLPLMPDATQYPFIDRVLVIDVPIITQIIRTVVRDDIPEKQVLRIIKSQPSREHRLTFANDIVDNSGSLGELHKALITLHQRYLLLALKK